jgi:hypothetical protein
LGSISPGSTVPIQLKVSVPPSTTGSLSATANVTSDLDDLNSKDNSVTTDTDVLPDSDGDGMPDNWEVLNGLSPNDSSDAVLDTDGDGFSNVQEYIAGTNPNDPNSIWTANVALSGADVVVSFQSAVSATYRVEYIDDLTNGSWMPLIDNVAGTGTVISETDPNAGGSPAPRFYRVLVSR